MGHTDFFVLACRDALRSAIGDPEPDLRKAGFIIGYTC